MKHLIWALVTIAAGIGGYVLGGASGGEAAPSAPLQAEPAEDDLAALLPADMVAAIRDETKRKTLVSIWDQISEKFGLASEDVLAASRLSLPEGLPASPFDLMTPKAGVDWPVVDNVTGGSAMEAAKDGWVVMNVWAGWCAPCVAELPDVQNAATALVGENITIFTVNADVTGKDTADVAKEILEQRSATDLPFIMAEGEEAVAVFTAAVFDDADSTSFPYTVIYAPGGQPFAVFSGGAVSDEPIWAGETGLAFFRALAKHQPG